MNHYDYHKYLRPIWDKAVDLYEKGNRDPESYFDAGESAYLASIGVNAQEVFDSAEDWVNSREPDFETFVLVHDLRRHYFVTVQQGEPSGHVFELESFPPKDAEMEGIAWLPRLWFKSLAKLRGELPADLMYGCGGDRRFFKEHDVHPAEFLRWVYENEDDPKVIVERLKERKLALTHASA